MSVFGIDLMNQVSKLPIPDPNTLISWQPGPPPCKAKLRIGFRNETKPTRQRTTSHHFLLLSVEFPKLTMPSRSTPLSQPPGKSCSNQPALTWIRSELPPKPPGMMQVPCLGINPWETVRSQRCAVDTAVSGALQRGFLGQHLCSGMQMPHEWVKGRDKRVRTRQQRRGIARHGSSSEALPLSNVTGATRKDQTASASWPFSSSFIVSTSILILLNVGRSDFISEKRIV